MSNLALEMELEIRRKREQAEKAETQADRAAGKADASMGHAARSGKDALKETAQLGAALYQGDIVKAASSGAVAAFSTGATIYNLTGAAMRTGEATRLLDAAKIAAEGAQTMEALTTALIHSVPEPEKGTPAWFEWYTNEYNLWRKEIITKISNTEEELCQADVYQKRLREIMPAYNANKDSSPPGWGVHFRGPIAQVSLMLNPTKIHGGNEIGLCVLEVWNSPLPISRLDFSANDAIRMFNTAAKVVRNRFDLRRMGLTILPDATLNILDSEFRAYVQVIEDQKANPPPPKSCCQKFCAPDVDVNMDFAVLPGFIYPPVMSMRTRMFTLKASIQKELKGDEAIRTALRYQAFRYLAYHQGYAVDDGVLALQTVVMNTKAKVFGFTLVDMRTLRPDELLLKSALPEIMQMASPTAADV